MAGDQAVWRGGERNLCGVASQRRRRQQLFVTVSRGLRRKRKGPLADPVLGGRPAEATSANAYTLNLWEAGEGRTLTKRQRERVSVRLEERRRGRRESEEDNRMLKEKSGVRLLPEWSGSDKHTHARSTHPHARLHGDTLA